MSHSIIADEINAGTLKDSSWASLNVIKFQQMYSISYIEEQIIRCKCLICPSTSNSGNNVRKLLLETYFLSS